MEHALAAVYRGKPLPAPHTTADSPAQPAAAAWQHTGSVLATALAAAREAAIRSTATGDVSGAEIARSHGAAVQARAALVEAKALAVAAKREQEEAVAEARARASEAVKRAGAAVAVLRRAGIPFVDSIVAASSTTTAASTTATSSATIPLGPDVSAMLAAVPPPESALKLARRLREANRCIRQAAAEVKQGLHHTESSPLMCLLACLLVCYSLLFPISERRAH